MKKVLLGALAIGMIAFSSCKKDDEGNGLNGELEPAMIQRALVWETTGAWCGYCPNGAEKMKVSEHQYGNQIIPIAYHRSDGLSTPTGNTLSSNFPSSGTPHFYVNNQNAGQSINGYIASSIAQTPKAAVGHQWSKEGTTYNVTAKANFYAGDQGTYYMGVYFLSGPIAATGSLVQSDFTDRLQNVNENGVLTTKWKVNAANAGGTFLIQAGSTYKHEHTIAAAATENVWGEPIPSNVVSAGDQYILNFRLNAPAQMNHEEGNIVTILWKDSGNGSYQYINGYIY